MLALWPQAGCRHQLKRKNPNSPEDGVGPQPVLEGGLSRLSCAAGLQQLINRWLHPQPGVLQPLMHDPAQGDPSLGTGRPAAAA